MDDLTPNQRELLAHWYDTPSFAAFKELLNTTRLNTATKLIDIDPKDIVSIARQQGRAAFAKELNLELKRNFQNQVRLEKKGNKQNVKPKKR